MSSGADPASASAESSPLDQVWSVQTAGLDIECTDAGACVAAALCNPAYAQMEEGLAARPPITVPAVTLDGTADGDFPATDGHSGTAHFPGPRSHHQVAGPSTFVHAVLESTAITGGRSS